LDAAWQEAASGIGPLTLRVGAAAVAPSARRPRIVWLRVYDETPEGSLATLAGRIEQSARACGFLPELRRFEGHVTLARARSGRRASAVDLPETTGLGSFVADRLVLYRSRLGGGGATYEELASYNFDAVRPS
jgi:2'-5' RNA ligase